MRLPGPVPLLASRRSQSSSSSQSSAAWIASSVVRLRHWLRRTSRRGKLSSSAPALQLGRQGLHRAQSVVLQESVAAPGMGLEEFAPGRRAPRRFPIFTGPRAPRAAPSTRWKTSASAGKGLSNLARCCLMIGSSSLGVQLRCRSSNHSMKTACASSSKQKSMSYSYER